MDGSRTSSRPIGSSVVSIADPDESPVAFPRAMEDVEGTSPNRDDIVESKRLAVRSVSVTVVAKTGAGPVKVSPVPVDLVQVIHGKIFSRCSP